MYFCRVNVISNIKLAIFSKHFLFLFSSCPQSSVFECEQEKNGFFAKHLLKNITDEHRNKSIEEVLLEVSRGELFSNYRKLYFTWCWLDESSAIKKIYSSRFHDIRDWCPSPYFFGRLFRSCMIDIDWKTPENFRTWAPAQRRLSTWNFPSWSEVFQRERWEWEISKARRSKSFWLVAKPEKSDVKMCFSWFCIIDVFRNTRRESERPLHKSKASCK